MTGQGFDAEANVPQPLPRSRAAGLLQLSKEVDCILWVVLWMVLSGFVILFNKWIFATGGFPHPLALTAMHMTSCFVVFGTIRTFASHSVQSTIMPDAHKEISWPAWAHSFLAMSLLFAITLGAGNCAYLVSTVPFLQMLKPMNCIVASLSGFVFGIEVPTMSHLIIVSIVASGVAFAASGQGAEFNMAGFLFQMAATSCEGIRCSLMQLATTSENKFDPVTTVYHFSAPTAILLWCACFLHEGVPDFSKLLSPWVLILNIMAAVTLNIIIATVIKKTSAVIFTLAGVVKDCGTIAVSSAVFGTHVTRSSMGGFSIAVLGIFMFKAYKDNIAVFKEKGFLSGFGLLFQRIGRNWKSASAGL